MRETKPNFPGLVLGLIMFVTGRVIFFIFVFNSILFYYKGQTLPYAGPYYSMDVTLYVSWGLISLIRHKVGNRGVARFDPTALFMFVLVTVFSIVSSVYFAFYQTYILRVEYPFNLFCLIVESVECFLGLLAGIMYKSQQSI